ncbi:LOW QUALITY PROTEIN: WD repeat-containing protein 89 [Cololabis saira]|uniref:LOW QUALITY PROTEIN: WD repeat-containing protein 89 n=1 Tax=Cololabis saira TaxID=129043 RepID=UPI002AD374B9|nr:LOW QUALITY PROTEIN: WD repeat-containing protein 89 [Cololabis saira]
MEDSSRGGSSSGGLEGLEEQLKGLSVSRRSPGKGPTYLLHAALQPAGLLAVSCSDRALHLHQRETLAPAGEYQGHTGPICGLKFAHASPALLYSGSADGSVRAWDVRRPGTEAVQAFSSDPAHSYLSFDLSCSDVLLCAGTEQLSNQDSFLVFWDCRKPGAGPLGVYSESHSDDITQVCFHPRDRERLASGSADGLVNVFDLRRGAEDDALLLTCNSDSGVGSVCWAGPDLQQLLCLGSAGGLHLWDLGRVSTDQPLALFSSGDARGAGLDYLVGGQWLEQARRLLVVGGGHRGDLHLLECDARGLRPLSTLGGGHSSVVRCFLWDAAGGALVTGGEDAQLLLWKPGGTELTPGRTESRKSQSALRVKAKPHQQHQYQKHEYQKHQDQKHEYQRGKRS